jgi:fatty acid CoA ligase FadD36
VTLFDFDQPDGGGRPAMSMAGRTLRRAELFDTASAVAARIEGAGAVAVHATPTVDTVVAVVGCLLAGVPVVPVPPDSGPDERRHITTDSGAELWFGPDIDGVGLPGVPPAGRPEPRGCEPADGAALVMYTSGTTGAPKGVPVTRSAIAACLDGLSAAWQWSPDDVLVHGLPLFHVHGLVLGVLGALRTGSPLVHTGKPTPSAYAAAEGTLFFGVPTVWSRIAADEESARALRSARLLVSGSAALPGPTHEALRRLAGQGPIERYGMTETLITLAQRAGDPPRPGWVGRPIPGVESRVVTDDGAAVAVDGETIGELEVRGTTVFGGYLHGGAAGEFTPDGWFRTGDAAVVDGAEHRIIGRSRDDLISSGGYRIGAGEIEDALRGHPAVADAAVVGLPDDDLGQRIVAYVVVSGATDEELVGHVAARLSAHKRPREIRRVTDLPRNALGKVQKSRLR